MDAIDFMPAMHELLQHIGYPENARDAFCAAMKPVFESGHSRPWKIADAFMQAHQWRWPEYDARLAELGVVRDEIASDIEDDDELDGMRFASDVDLSPAQAFCSRVMLVAMAQHRQAQMLNVSAMRPFWRFRYNDSQSTDISECKSRDREIGRWDSGSRPGVPCWRADCRCYVESLSQSEVQS